MERIHHDTWVAGRGKYKDNLTADDRSKKSEFNWRQPGKDGGGSDKLKNWAQSIGKVIKGYMGRPAGNRARGQACWLGVF